VGRLKLFSIYGLNLNLANQINRIKVIYTGLPHNLNLIIPYNIPP